MDMDNCMLYALGALEMDILYQNAKYLFKNLDLFKSRMETVNLD